MWELLCDGDCMFVSDSPEYLRGLRDGMRLFNPEDKHEYLIVENTRAWNWLRQRR